MTSYRLRPLQGQELRFDGLGRILGFGIFGFTVGFRMFGLGLGLWIRVTLESNSGWLKGGRAV